MNRRKLFFLSILGSIPILSKFSMALPSHIKSSNFQKESEFGAVYHCDFPQEQRFSAMLNNIVNHLNNYNADPMKIKIIVVLHGPGVKFLMKSLQNSPWDKEEIDTSKYIQKAKDLTTYDVEFWLCNNTLKNLKLKEEDFPDFCKVVPSGVATITELQSKGFSYIKPQ